MFVPYVETFIRHQLESLNLKNASIVENTMNAEIASKTEWIKINLNNTLNWWMDIWRFSKKIFKDGYRQLKEFFQISVFLFPLLPRFVISFDWCVVGWCISFERMEAMKKIKGLVQSDSISSWRNVDHPFPNLWDSIHILFFAY